MVWVDIFNLLVDYWLYILNILKFVHFLFLLFIFLPNATLYFLSSHLCLPNNFSIILPELASSKGIIELLSIRNSTCMPMKLFCQVFSQVFVLPCYYGPWIHLSLGISSSRFSLTVSSAAFSPVPWLTEVCPCLLSEVGSSHSQSGRVLALSPQGLWAISAPFSGLKFYSGEIWGQPYFFLFFLLSDNIFP